MNQLGLTHLSLRVDDVDRVALDDRGPRGHGGAEHSNHGDMPGARLDFLYCTDPDGVRIELMDLPG